MEIEHFLGFDRHDFSGITPKCFWGEIVTLESSQYIKQLKRIKIRNEKNLFFNGFPKNIKCVLSAKGIFNEMVFFYRDLYGIYVVFCDLEDE